jgi:hypothetical protein
VRVKFQQPLGNQHHQNALAAALGVPDHTAFLLLHPLLGRFHAVVLMDARHLLLPAIEDDEVADQIQQAHLVKHLRQWFIQQSTLSKGL